MSDLISRQAAIDLAKDLMLPGMDYLQHNQAIMNYEAELVRLPSVEPERKTGRWIPHDCLGRPSIDKDACSCCGQRFYQIAETGCEWNFCPNCGARMEVEK